MVVVTKQTSTRRILKLNYEISNNSPRDVWVCKSVSRECDFEVFPEDDGRTLVVRKRLDVPSYATWYAPPFGRYERLGADHKLCESLLLPSPVPCLHVYSKLFQTEKRVEYATRIAIEIGYCDGKRLGTYLDMLKRTETADPNKLSLFRELFAGIVTDTGMNEALRPRDDQILVFYTKQRFKAEQLLRTTVDNISIPYQQTIPWIQFNTPDLTTCTRLKIHYEPSMLDYFYPYENERRLLNEQEIEYLQSQKSVDIEDAKGISDFANVLKKARKTVGGIVSERSKATVIGYHDNRRVTSFVVYDDTYIETEQKQRIKYFNELQNLREYTLQVQPFELRTQCASSLKKLWYRLRSYSRVEERRIQSLRNLKLYDSKKRDTSRKTPDIALNSKKVQEDFAHEAESFFESRKRDKKELDSPTILVYPAPRIWCDTMEWTFAGSTKGEWHDSKMKVHVCPGVSKGRSTYAMNRSCKYDSPPDMILLFETRAGWNQHGGPKLFTFNNHDPKGGCVLLNDGTVKFIRTKEELQQLRWK